jgi:hypothetical protein
LFINVSSLQPNIPLEKQYNVLNTALRTRLKHKHNYDNNNNMTCFITKGTKYFCKYEQVSDLANQTAAIN